MERTTISAIPWCIPKHLLCHRCPPLLTRGLFGECSPCRWSTIHFSRPWVRPRTVPEQTPIALKVSTQGPVRHGISPNMRVWGNGRMSSMQSAIARHTPRNQKRKSHGKPNWKASDNIFHTPLVCHVCDKKTSYLLTGTATSQRSHFPPSQIFHAKRNDFRSGMARSSWLTSKKLPDCIFRTLDEDEDFVDFLDNVDVPCANWSLSQTTILSVCLSVVERQHF